MDTQKTSPTHTGAPATDNVAVVPFPILLTIPDAARRLTVSVRSLYRLIERGELIAIRILADTPRIRAADVDALIARRVAEATADCDTE